MQVIFAFFFAFIKIFYILLLISDEKYRPFYKFRNYRQLFPQTCEPFPYEKRNERVQRFERGKAADRLTEHGVKRHLAVTAHEEIEERHPETEKQKYYIP